MNQDRYSRHDESYHTRYYLSWSAQWSGKVHPNASAPSSQLQEPQMNPSNCIRDTSQRFCVTYSRPG